MNLKSKLGNDGRVVVPAVLRRQAGIEPGEDVNFSLEDGKIILTGANRALDDLRSALDGVSGNKKSLLQQLYELRKEDVSYD